MASILKTVAFERYTTRLESSLSIAFIILGLFIIPSFVIVAFYVSHESSGHRLPEGCTKFGLQTRSNLADEHNTRCTFTDSSTRGTQPLPKVKSLWIYPVKSCRGIELHRGDVTRTGMRFDRLFCFAQLKSPFPVSLDTSQSEKSKHRWKFITQRDFPMLALVKTEIWLPDPSSATYSSRKPYVQSGGALMIKYPYEGDGLGGVLARMWAFFGGGLPHKSVLLPLSPTIEQLKENEYTLEEMEIWKDSPLSWNMANTVGTKSELFMEELQAHLGCSNPLALFRVSPEHHRKVYRCAPRQEQIGWQPEIGFGDAYPLHILNLASVQDVGSKLGEHAPRLGALRFRPNIIFTGLEPYAEDEWKRIKIGGYEYFVSCRTVRCLLPNVDPETGIKDKAEPNKTLKDFRCIDEGAKGMACMGMQMVPADDGGQIAVGDSIQILETGKHHYIKQ